MAEGDRAFIEPSESFLGAEGCRVCDFWRWAYSDLLSNTNRPIIAEYLVGEALGVLSQPRVEWDTVDFEYRGRGVEVKSAAYVQTWDQTRPSAIIFDIGEKRCWNADTGRYEEGKRRHADCYVFCLLTEKDRSRVNPLDLTQWKFYVLSTSTINAIFGAQKTVALSRIEECCRPVAFAHLKGKIDEVIDRLP